ncbi:MAG: LON peptidase substrate-binding domain-containing protein [Polyangiaceae bacterium]|jgi:Lon protease-like protein
MDAEQILEPALDALPVFPLPGVVLFPGTPLPLHVFEPRYRAMLADCLATHRCLALACLLTESFATDPDRPRFAPIAGAGVIVQHTPLSDGRSTIVVQGCARVALVELPFVAPYRRARARVLSEVQSFVPSTERMGLHAAAAAFAQSLPRADRKNERHLPAGIEIGAAADLYADHWMIDPGARQRTLEELDVARRVRFVTMTLAEQMSRIRKASLGKPD